MVRRALAPHPATTPDPPAMRILLMLAVFAVGFLQPVQAGFNAHAAEQTGSRLQSCLVNGIAYFILIVPVMLVVQAAGGKVLPTLESIKAVPWWAHAAGLFGAAIVLTQLTAAPMLGAGLLVAIFVAGQALGSIAADHYGFPGYRTLVTHPERWIGLGLVVIGVILVARPWAGTAALE